MTKITLHGILAKEFKKTFNLAVKKPKEVFDAISCSHENFRNRIVELASQGIHFTLLIDGKKITTMEELSIAAEYKKIDIVPLVCGHAGVVAAIVTVAVNVGAFIAANAAFFIQLGVTIATTALQMMLAPKPRMKRPESTVNAVKESFLFSSKANVAEQGIPVPVGYGRLRVGSAVIQSTIKSYPHNFEKNMALKNSGGSLLTNDKKS